MLLVVCSVVRFDWLVNSVGLCILWCFVLWLIALYLLVFGCWFTVSGFWGGCVTCCCFAIWLAYCCSVGVWFRWYVVLVAFIALRFVVWRLLLFACACA